MAVDNFDIYGAVSRRNPDDPRHTGQRCLQAIRKRRIGRDGHPYDLWGHPLRRPDLLHGAPREKQPEGQQQDGWSHVSKLTHDPGGGMAL